MTATPGKRIPQVNSAWNKTAFKTDTSKGNLTTRQMNYCKLGKHSIPTGTPYVWLTHPMGISCRECAEAAGQGGGRE